MLVELKTLLLTPAEESLPASAPETERAVQEAMHAALRLRENGAGTDFSSMGEEAARRLSPREKDPGENRIPELLERLLAAAARGADSSERIADLMERERAAVSPVYA